MPGLIRRNIIHQYRGTPHQVRTCTTLLLNHIRRSQLSSAQLRLSSAQRSAVRCCALPCGAVQSSARWCCAVPCPTVRCGSVRFCAVLRTLLYLLFRTCQFSFDEASSSSTEVHHTRYVCACTALSLNHNKCSQLSSAIAQQRAAQRRAMPCCTVLRCAFITTHRTRYHVRTQVPGTSMYVCVRVFFAFFINRPPSRSSSRFFPLQITPAPPIRT